MRAFFMVLTFLAAALGCTANGHSRPPGGEIGHIGPLNDSGEPSDKPPLRAPALTAAQKAAIFSAVMLEKSESKVNDNLNVTVGQPVPTVELHQLPPDALGEMPIARSYRYTVLAGQVVLVDLATMRVVDIIKP
jgi:Protein of unknown function (DUF1236)